MSMTGVKRACALLPAVLVLMLGTTVAHALRSLEASGETRFSGSTAELTFAAPSLGEIICAVTASGTVSRAIPKLEGTVVGEVTGVTIGTPATCRVARGVRAVNAISVLATPWPIHYQSFLGSLPSINGFIGRISRVQFLLEFTDIIGQNYRCLYSAEPSGRMVLERSEITRLELSELRISGTGLRGSAACPQGELRGTYTLASPVRIRLV